MRNRNIGLFGGSFDPPHLGHVALVQAGLAMGMDEVWVIPALPVHRELSGLADARTRFEWLVQIFEDQPCVQVLDWEISRQQPTPAIKTLRQFHQMYAQTIPWLMMGADTWAGLPTWREYPAHRDLCNVAVFARRGIALETVCAHNGWHRVDINDGLDCQQLDCQQLDCHQLDSHQSGCWAYIPVDLPNISATGVRHDAQQGVSLTGKVPEVVRKKIEQAYSKAMENM